MNEAIEDRAHELEAAGHRLIDGGQVANFGWSITDWRTGETISSGGGDYTRYAEEHQRLDPDKMWRHIDVIHGEVGLVKPTKTEGVPDSLADALEAWIAATGTPSEDIAELIGWPVDEVERCRS
jgi:hypothetical protein